MPIRMTLLTVCFAILLVGCGPKKPLTPEEQLMQEAQNECARAANSIVDPPHSSNNPFWDAYFTMCMKTEYGYTDAELRKLWY